MDTTQKRVESAGKNEDNRDLAAIQHQQARRMEAARPPYSIERHRIPLHRRIKWAARALSGLFVCGGRYR